jgi:LPS-assembly protein
VSSSALAADVDQQFPSAAPGSAASGRAEPSLAINSSSGDAKPAGAGSALPDGSLPDAPGYPIAEVVEAPPAGVPVVIRANQQEKHGDVFTLTGEVRIDYKDYILTADKVSFNRLTSDAEADGHVRLEGKRNNELILADHGKLNFDLETGRFENVTGSVGRQPSASKRKLVYTTANPFLFTGKVLIKEGPERYEIIEGTMTSCLLPDPDWRIHSSLIRVNYGQARAKNSYFTLLGVPILLPALRHPPGKH